MKDKKLLGTITRNDLLRNEAYIRSFLEDDKSLQENTKPTGKWKWGNRGRVPYWVKKLNSIFNIE